MDRVLTDMHHLSRPSHTEYRVGGCYRPLHVIVQLPSFLLSFLQLRITPFASLDLLDNFQVHTRACDITNDREIASPRSSGFQGMCCRTGCACVHFAYHFRQDAMHPRVTCIAILHTTVAVSNRLNNSVFLRSRILKGLHSPLPEVLHSA